MCEFSSKLIAWLDREMPEIQAQEMDRHVARCNECRQQAEKFRAISRAFADCFLPPLPPVRHSGRRVRYLVPAAIAAGLIAVLFLTSQRPAHEPQQSAVVAPIAPVETPDVSPAVVAATPAAHLRRRVNPPSVRWQPVEPTIQIVIPGDALFPPGAVPEGVGFVADMRLAADGSPVSLTLRP